MNLTAKLMADDLARACADAMWKEDDASQGLGMEIVEIKAGEATLAMTVQPHMVNGHGIAHGGFIFTLADSAFAFACNSHNERTVAAQCDISFIRPGKLGDRLVATAREISRTGRSGIYDVSVTVDDDRDRRIARSFPQHRRRTGCHAGRPDRNENIEDLEETCDGFDQPSIRKAAAIAPRWTRPNAPRATKSSRCRPKRLAWSLAHAYDNVAHYRKAFDKAGVHPSDFRQLSDLAKFPFTIEDRSARQLSLQHVRGAAREAGARSTPPPAPPASRSWSATPGPISRPGRIVMARSIRAAGGRSGMIIHNAYGYGLFTGGLGVHYGAERLGCTVMPISGGMTERQVQLINDFKPDIIMVTPSYMLAILDEFKRQGLDPRQSLAEDRHLRRRALDQRDARRDRRRRSTWTPPTSTACRR